MRPPDCLGLQVDGWSGARLRAECESEVVIIFDDITHLDDLLPERAASVLWHQCKVLTRRMVRTRRNPRHELWSCAAGFLPW